MSKTMAEKHVLDRGVFEDTAPGRMAIDLAGDEPAHELFVLLMQLVQVSMADKVSYEGENGQVEAMPLPDEPLFFEKPLYPHTMEIVRRLKDKNFLRLYSENEHGVAYTLNVPAPKKRAAWLEAVTNEILGAEVEPVFKNVGKPFTYAEQIRIMNAMGIPVGATFDFRLLDGAHFQMELTPTQMEVRGGNPDKMLLVSAVIFWQLQAFGQKYGLGEFSNPTPPSELEQAMQVAKHFCNPMYNTMPVEEIISHMETECRSFWMRFKKEYVQQK